MITPIVQIQDTDTPRLLAIRGQVRSRRALMTVAGKRLEKELRSHFDRKNRQGNAKGWPRSNFWAQTVRAATSFTGATDDTATVTIASPEFAHKVKGGRVRAKRGKYLAIPLTARAKAAGSPREGGWRGASLVLFRSRRGRLLLVESGYTEIRSRRTTGGEPQYLLVRSVYHRPDPTALPPRSDVGNAIDDEARKFLERQIRRSQP